MLFVAGELAEKRKARGLKLNFPEAIALIASQLQEAARDRKSVAELMQFGPAILTRDDAMEGIPEMFMKYRLKLPFPMERSWRQCTILFVKYNQKDRR